jgi:hypothetical protein
MFGFAAAASQLYVVVLAVAKYWNRFTFTLILMELYVGSLVPVSERIV